MIHLISSLGDAGLAFSNITRSQNLNCPIPLDSVILALKNGRKKILKNKKIEKKKIELVTNSDNYMQSFRENIDSLMDINDYTIKELSEKADMSFDTLKTFLYGDSKDCKLSTAVKLSRVFGISVDELVGCGTIEEKSRESLAMTRSMPDHVMYLIRSFIRHQYNLFNSIDNSSKHIPVLLPECRNGYLPTTNVTTTVCIDHLTDNLKSRVCLGIQIPCEHYEPFYMPNDIILLAADRSALNNERCVITYKGNLFFAIKKIYIENGIKKWKYISMIDGKTEVLPNYVDDKIGHVVGFLNPDGSWGIR